MKALLRVSGCLAAIVFSLRAWGQEASPSNGLPPPSGMDLEASGIVLSAIGALSFVTAPICKTSVVIPQQQSSCFDVSFAVGAPFLAAGISLIVVGAMQHAKYAAWVRSHPGLLALSFTPTGGASSPGGALAWSATF